MATVTSRRAAPTGKTLENRKALCEELLDIERKLAPSYARMEAIGIELKKIATDSCASFKDEFAGKGSVSVAPATTAEFKGDVPQIQTEAWQKLKPAERKQLEKTGLVKVTPQWSKASNGRVTVKLF